MPHLIARNLNDGILPELISRNVNDGINAAPHCPECEWWNITEPHCPECEWWNKCRTSLPGIWMIWVAERWCAGPPRCRVLLSCASSVSLSSHCIAAPFALPAGSGSTTSINQTMFAFFINHLFLLQNILTHAKGSLLFLRVSLGYWSASVDRKIQEHPLSPAIYLIANWKHLL